MAGPGPSGASGDATYAGLVRPLLLPTWAVVGILMVLPVCLMAVYSFLTKEFRGGVIWDFTLAAYDQFFITRGLFGDEPARIEWTYIGIFWRSIWQAGLATLLCLFIGFPTAWFIATRPARSRGVWLFLITIPYWVNLLIRTVSLKFLIRETGPLNESLMAIGLIDTPLPLVNTNLAVQLGLFYSYLPFMVLPIYSTLEKLDYSLVEAALDLGCTRLSAFWKVTMPLAIPGIVAGCLLVFIPAVGEFVIPDLLGGSRTLMIGKTLWSEFFNNRDWPLSSAVAVLLLLVLVIPIALFQQAQARAQEREKG